MVVPTVFNPASEARKLTFCMAIIIHGKFSIDLSHKQLWSISSFLFQPSPIFSIILNKTIILADLLNGQNGLKRRYATKIAKKLLKIS